MRMKEKDYTHIGRKEKEVDAAFWKELYRIGDTGWDQGDASPGLVDFLKEKNYKTGRVLVPGCGRGHDARALAKAGFDVIGIDLVETAVMEASQLAISEGYANIRFEQSDFFNMPTHLQGPYDLIFEHTFFCAIDPAMRNLYVETASGLLKKEGDLLGVFYNIQPESGPPFGTTREELMERFSPRFTLLFECMPRSFSEREGEELLMLWRKR